MAAAASALPPCAEAVGREAQVRLRHSHCELAQGPAQALGRGALVREAPRRWRVARSGADRCPMARTPRRTPQLSCLVVDRADVSGLACCPRDLSASSRAECAP